MNMYLKDIGLKDDHKVDGKNGSNPDHFGKET